MPAVDRAVLDCPAATVSVPFGVMVAALAALVNRNPTLNGNVNPAIDGKLI